MPKSTYRELLQAWPDSGPVSLAAIDPDETHGIGKRRARKRLAAMQKEMKELQERLYAEQRRSVLLVLQGMDTSGKDGTIEHAISGLNPQGVRIRAFKAPTAEELRHDFLWRIRREVPGPGLIAIFNRSQYEDVLVARVRSLAPPEVVEGRYARINDFEAAIARRGVVWIKCCLHISHQEQRDRLLARLEDPTKRWKFQPEDLEERRRWPDYQAAYDLALNRCSTAAAPWYVVPANRRWFRNYAVSRLLLEVLRDLNPAYPQPGLDVAALRLRLLADETPPAHLHPAPDQPAASVAIDEPRTGRRPAAGG